MNAYPDTQALPLAGPPYVVPCEYSTQSGPVSAPFTLPGVSGVFQVWNREFSRVFRMSPAVIDDDGPHIATYQVVDGETIIEKTYSFVVYPIGISLDGPNVPEIPEGITLPGLPWRDASFYLPINIDINYTNAQVGFTGEPFTQSHGNILPRTILHEDGRTYESVCGEWPPYSGNIICTIGWVEFSNVWGAGKYIVKPRESQYYNSHWPVDPASDIPDDPAPFECYSWFDMTQHVRLMWHPLQASANMLPQLTALALMGSLCLMGGITARPPKPKKKLT